MKTIASFAPGRALLARAGVQPHQYQLLVDLFAALGERKELTGNLGMDRHALQMTMVTLLLPGALMALMAFMPGPLASFSFFTLLLSSLVLLIALVIEAANSFFNPSEVTVLAHQPIAGATYFAAKLSYLVQVVIRLELAVNGPAALAGLVKPEARWFYPVTHLAAAFGAGIFLALVACACFGLMFRVVPASRLRSAALWAQIAVATLPFLVNLPGRRLRWLGAAFASRVPSLDWSFVPLAWFNALGTIGQGGGLVPLRWPALAAMAVSAIFIGFGLRALSSGYMTRIVNVLRSSGRIAGRVRRSSFGGRVVRRLTGRPSGQAAYAFMSRMMRRDWQFRRALAQLILPLLILAPAVVLDGRAHSPLGAARPRVIGLLPEVLLIGSFLLCLVIDFSDHHRGATVFNHAPGPGLRGFVRGMFWTLWLLLLALPLFVAGAFYSYYWGALDAVLFTFYGFAVASCFLGVQMFLLRGLPFSRPPQAERSQQVLVLLVVAMVVVGVAWIFQAYLVFPSRWLTVATTVVVGAATWVVVRGSLRRLERKAREQLASQRGSPGLFAEPPGSA